MEELDLKELIAMFLEKKILIILVIIIFALLGAVYTLKFVTPIYRSSTTLILAQTTLNRTEGELTSITQGDIALNANLVDNYKKIAESRRVASKVIENLGLSESIESIMENTTVSTSSDTEFIEITVSNTNPELACKIANELAIVFTDEALQIYKVNNVNILDEAVISLTPANVNLFKNIVLFAFVGGVIVAVYILLINMLDTTVKTDVDIERAIGLPVLASIVLTEDAPKKKKTKSSGKRSRLMVNGDMNRLAVRTMQEYSKVDPSDDMSMYSFIHKDDIEDINSIESSNSRKKSTRNSDGKDDI